MSYESIAGRIAACRDCPRAARTPFSFPMDNQPVMLISAAPSMQAMYKPLYSIRFFRSLCLALFGDKYLRERGEAWRYLHEFCGGNIYWTHFCKCYQPELESFDEIDTYCAEQFLYEEFVELKRNLKLIIVLGEAIHEKVKALAPPELLPIMRFMPFPSPETIGQFEGVSRELGRHLKDLKGKTGFVYKDGASRYTEESSTLDKHDVHLRFEQKAFVKMLSDEEPTLDGSIEDVWHKNLVVPNRRRCAKLVQVFSFVETQIKIQMHDYFYATGNFTVLRDYRGAQKKPSMYDVGEKIRDNWKNSNGAMFIEYVEAVAPARKADAQNLMLRFLRLTKYRNAIVHDGGLLENRVTAEANGLPGIYSFAGTVFVDAEGEETLLSLVREATELLCSIG